MDDLARILAVVGVLVLLAYLDARANPFKPCSACGGGGKEWARGGKKYRRCPVCKDGPKKERRRLVARIFGTGR